MKIIVYTLNSNGTVPEYIIDGGYFSVANNNASPQDLDLVGIANDDAPQPGFVNKTALAAYIESKGLEFKDLYTKEIIPISTVVDTFWAKLTE